MAASTFVAGRLESIDAYRNARTIAGYWAVGGELPLLAVVAAIGRDPRRLFYLPRIAIAAAGEPEWLEFAPWRSGDPVTLNRFGIPEPEAGGLAAASALDVVLVPLLGFDRRGHRLGSGGGFYDRSFGFRQSQPAPPLLIGVAFACQELEAIEPEPWDVDLDWVVTEGGVVECRSTAT